jgi:hypothetical protein
MESGPELELAVNEELCRVGGFPAGAGGYEVGPGVSLESLRILLDRLRALPAGIGPDEMNRRLAEPSRESDV